MIKTEQNILHELQVTGFGKKGKKISNCLNDQKKKKRTPNPQMKYLRYDLR